MKRVVLDTNIFVSGLIKKKGSPGEILKAWRKGLFLLIISPEIIEEINRVLREKKFSKRGITDDDIKGLSFALLLNAITVIPTIKVKTIKEDPEDNKFLECALAGKADYIVSGDTKHLQPLKKFQGIPILSPAKFATILI
ncbi:MAG: putative toxin-antitoxin system toxin component, PIN family [bacterium (Candidatus Ratteibacteria) CG_4_10_14_3_um_filter_41_18]|uniref:Putative toxin-antitoxin system toxin component, PIN family n=4 Tax=Candidatus Ratteibacteria TaxID=2979319 RepID=A0A2M7E818_9BACT|nr:MAG: putative toxin-antitoxin system toxin component, PIN family [bacterium (Candidatus Ratteibacteria) CG01_land_8_20_14_3_00_40_19]PIW31415.1 MAG: putative toxin-antitoxin system toxin component, PIN family [bacterium (Candidatus Ratteibacteria) CG15_BIG_FIL_POST_REV_8_21_14_020_41_12]PIX77683.1 MAG: putative toxin-antitoxin system toxin component, PIN family [bacterium (Candidatus Ratteibacteria) CG_4_10_14_3_um_filter_41_18]PJA62564.1 MAG: putative toxin-antitoxin system toxin component, 